MAVYQITFLIFQPRKTGKCRLMLIIFSMHILTCRHPVNLRDNGFNFPVYPLLLVYEMPHLFMLKAISKKMLSNIYIMKLSGKCNV